MKKNKLLFLFLWVISFAFFAFKSISNLLHPMISSSDGYWRLILGIQKANNTFINDFFWPPFHSSFLGWIIKLFPQHNFISTRLITLISIVVTGVIIFKITEKIIADKNFAIFASSIFFLNPLIISISNQTLSEPIWLLFTTLSIFFIFFSGNKYFCLGCLCFLISQATRYESWYLSPIILFFIYKNFGIKKSVLFAVTSLIFPVYWLISTYVYTNDLLRYFHEKMSQAQKGPKEIYWHLDQSFFVWSQKLLDIFSPISILFLLIDFFRKKNRVLFTLSIFIFLSLVIQVYLGTMEFFPHRYLILITITGIPVIVSCLYSFLSKNRFSNIILISFFTVTAIHSYFSLNKMSEYELPEAKDIAIFLKQNYLLPKKVYFNEKPGDSPFLESYIFYNSESAYQNFEFYNFFTSKNFNDDKNETKILVIEKGWDEKLNPIYNNLVSNKKIVFENKYFLAAK